MCSFTVECAWVLQECFQFLVVLLVCLQSFTTEHVCVFSASFSRGHMSYSILPFHFIISS